MKSLDREDYSHGQPFLVSILIRNITNQPLTLPWEPDINRVPSPDSDSVRAILSLAAVPERRTKVTIPLALLYGSVQNPQTVRILKPGEEAEVVADGGWEYSLSPPAAPTQSFRNVTVAAQLSVLTALDGHVYDDVRSSNRIAIKLLR